MITLICLVSMIMIIWFNSEFAYYWGKLLGLRKLMLLDEYHLRKTLSLDIPLSYPLFLQMKSDNFFVHLITCKVCLCVWLSIIASLILGTILYIPIIYVLSIILYGTMSQLLK